MSLLDLQERVELREAVEALGFRPHMIAETGSKAWGTDVATSDHDLTVIADDIVYDIYQWPRCSNTFPIQFKGQKVDVRIFSIEHFLRKVLKSNLVAYEAINSEWHYGPGALRNILNETMHHFYDPREMFRSSRGNLGNIRAGEMKGRRQQFRYTFICLQLLDELVNGNKPMMNVPAYLNSTERARDPCYFQIQELYKWAMSENTDDEMLNQSVEHVMTQVRQFDYPNVVHIKQGAERVFMNAQFAKIKEMLNG